MKKKTKTNLLFEPSFDEEELENISIEKSDLEKLYGCSLEEQREQVRQEAKKKQRIKNSGV